jgi:hypothetical protein
MRTTQNSIQKRKATISFSYDPIIGYSWASEDTPGASSKAAIGGGGHRSMLEILSDSGFLGALVERLGKGCMPRGVIANLKREEEDRRMPIPVEAVEKFMETFPDAPVKMSAAMRKKVNNRKLHKKS